MLHIKCIPRVYCHIIDKVCIIHRYQHTFSSVAAHMQHKQDIPLKSVDHYAPLPVLGHLIMDTFSWYIHYIVRERMLLRLEVQSAVEPVLSGTCPGCHFAF